MSTSPRPPPSLPPKGEMSPHVQITFRALFEELGSMKEQQWKITNYAVLLLAAAFALKSRANPNALLHIVWATVMIGSLLLLRIQWSMGRYRMRIDRVHRAYFSDQELIDVGLTPKQRSSLDSMKQFDQSIRGSEFVLALIVVLIGGALLFSFTS